MKLLPILSHFFSVPLRISCPISCAPQDQLWRVLLYVILFVCLLTCYIYILTNFYFILFTHFLQSVTLINSSREELFIIRFVHLSKKKIIDEEKKEMNIPFSLVSSVSFQ